MHVRPRYRPLHNDGEGVGGASMEWPGGGNEYRVELYQQDLYITGALRHARSNQSVVDILNTEEPDVEVLDATVQTAGSAMHFDSLRILKGTLSLAIPRETAEQTRHMLLQRTLM